MAAGREAAASGSGKGPAGAGPAATLRSAMPGSWGGTVPAARFNLLALMGRERAVRGGKELFEEIFDDRMPISG